MSESSIPPAAETPAPVETALDPVAAARAVMAGQSAKVDEIVSLQRQVKSLWIVSGVTIVLVLVMAVFTLLPRFGMGFGLGGRPTFQRGMMQNGQAFPGQGQGGGQGGTTTNP